MIITVHVIPRASDNKLVKMDDDTFRARVSAPPEKGKANQAVIRLLADYFDIAPSRISLIRGATTRIKQFEVT